MQPVKALADAVRADRKPVRADNPLLRDGAGRLDLDHDLLESYRPRATP